MRPARRRLGAGATSLIASVLVVGLWSAPAGADPARPTNFESRILSVEPPIEGARVEIQGGDAFVVLSVEPGHEALVPDYGSEGGDRPYLRFAADGTVEVNEHSAAYASNDSRYGTSPEGFDPSSEPRWTTVAEDGSYAWHDHRVHLMVPEDLAVVDASGRVHLGGPDGTWEVPVTVDGVDTLITGELIRRQAPAAWPWYGVALVLGAAVLSLAVGAKGRARGKWVAAAPTVVLLLGSAAAVWVSAAELGRAPEGSGASAVPVLVAGAALVGAVAAVASRALGERADAVSRVGTALSAAALLWWSITRLDVFDSAILPSNLGAFDRTATAVGLGIGAAVALLLVWRPSALVPAGPATQGDTEVP